jgi:hypothetical protein
VNCYEWRKKILVKVSVDVSYSVTGTGFTESGSGTITHENLYNDWTHRELQCEGGPLSNPLDWALRGPNLCQGRSFIVGQLTQSDTVTITQTIDGQPPTIWQAGVFFETQINGLWYPQTSLLVYPQYPDWEKDPYSTALKNVIDGLTGNYLYAGIYDTQFGPPMFPNPSPQAPIALPWFKDGASNSNGELSISLSVNISLP